ncbi:MAG: DUF4178 domain-containing protein [Acidimicrobiia bacterium]|nr:DUF4178 domain-containing protein [Acidimicrobiia bacterium]
MVDVLEIAVGDSVSIGGQPWTVIGSVTFRDDDGWTWQEHLLESGGERRWLAVEDDDGVEMVLWAPTNVTVAPGAHEMIHDGRSYQLDETGTASYVATGHTGTLPQGTLEYYDYAGRGGLALSFERFDGSGWEMTAGTAVDPAQVQVQRP